MFKSENFLAPIGLCMISAAAKAAGHETFLCELNSKNAFNAAAELRPDIIAYSSSTGELKHYLKLNKEIKIRFPGVFTIMGGPHPTFFPDVVSEGGLDAICIGEGERAFVALLKALETGAPIDSIPNIAVRNNREKPEIGNLEQDLDQLPFPDYGLLYDNTPMGRYPVKNFMVSRGCPYECTYCFNASWNRLYKDKGNILRRHSVDYVIEDITKVKKRWPLSTVKFYDDIFIYKADGWLEEFSEKYKKLIDIPFFILTRADLLDEDMVRLLKHAGCRTISMSIESGNPGIRNMVLKRNMSNEQIVDAHMLCKKYGIYTFTNCIVGLPGATTEHEIESIDLAIKSRADWAEFLIFHPYPGTRLGDELIRDGYYSPDYAAMHTSYMHETPLNSFSEKEMRALSNLSVLGPVAVTVPFLKNIIIKHLIFFRHNFLFTFIYYLIKMYVIRKKIYVTRTTMANSAAIFIRSLKQELFRHESKDES